MNKSSFEIRFSPGSGDLPPCCTDTASPTNSADPQDGQ